MKNQITIKRNLKGQWAKGNNSGQRFNSENSRGNQHAKGNPPNATTFTKGKFVMDKHPSWRGGLQRMKNDCVWVNIGPNKRARRPKLVWEEVYGDLPKGYVIWHIDGNRYNDTLGNLEAISRGEMMRRNSRH